MHSKFSSAFLLPLFASATLATSATQCRGSCHHEQRSLVRNQVPHTVRIDGPSHLVADLTRPSGWEILDCPRDWDKGAVDVRLVCTHKDGSDTCDHVFEGGAENTVVRLPLECGTGPFARIAQWAVAKDRAVPASSIAGYKLRRRNLTPPVFAARLDYNFGAIPHTRGEVTFDIVASHHSDINDNIQHAKHVPRAIREAMSSPNAATPTNSIFGLPDLPDLPDIPDIPIPDIPIPDIPIPDIPIPDIPIPTIPPITIPDLPDLPDLPTIPPISIPPLPTSLPDIDFPDIDWPDIDIPFEEFPMPDLPSLEGGIEKSKGFEAIKLTGNHSLVDESLGCNFGKIGFDQSAKISVETDVLINAGYALKIAGKLVPPEVNDFALAGALSGKIHATLNVDMYLSLDMLLPPIKILPAIGVPGLSIPGLFTIGPKAVLLAQLDIVVDVAFAARIPMTYDFQKLDFVFPKELAPPEAEAQESKKTSSLELNISPGEQTGSLGLHIIPKLEFGIEVLHDLASAEVYVGVDTDITFNSNGTVYPDFSYDGCQDLSVGMLAKTGVSAGIKILHVGDYIPLYEKRHTLWQHCSKPETGPTTAVYDNADGTFTNAGGDLVNQNGQLIDEKGEVIPDADAADAAPPPIKGEDGKDIPEEDLILDNGDGSFEDAQGNPTNKDGQRITNNGTLLACELDTSQLVDAQGAPIPPEEVIIDNGDGTFSNANCDIVNADGQLVDADGNVIDYEPFKDETGAEIPPSEVVIDNEDGTYSDPYGNSVDQWGSAMDFDENGEVIPVELTPVEDDDGTQEEREPEVTDDPAFTIMSPDQLNQLVVDLIHGKASAPSPAPPTEAPPTEAPPTEAPPTDAPPTDAPPASPETPSPEAPAPETTTTSPESPPSEEPTLVPNPIPVPAPTGACKAPAKRSVTSEHVSLFPTQQVSAAHKRRRAILGKRAGSIGCSMPSIGGLPLYPPIPGMDELARLF